MTDIVGREKWQWVDRVEIHIVGKCIRGVQELYLKICRKRKQNKHIKSNKLVAGQMKTTKNQLKWKIIGEFVNSYSISNKFKW